MQIPLLPNSHVYLKVQTLNWCKNIRCMWGCHIAHHIFPIRYWLMWNTIFLMPIQSRSKGFITIVPTTSKGVANLMCMWRFLECRHQLKISKLRSHECHNHINSQTIVCGFSWSWSKPSSKYAKGPHV